MKKALSLADCFTIALAKKMDLLALFSRRDNEIVNEIKREPLDVEIRFLENVQECVMEPEKFLKMF